MTFSSLRALWLLAGLAAAGAAGHWLLVGRPRQAATLGRLAAADSCLTAHNRQLATRAQAILAGLEQAVARNRNHAADVAVLHQAAFIVATGSALADSLRQVRRRWPAGSSPARLARLSAQATRCLDTLRAYVPDETLDARPSAIGNGPVADWPVLTALPHQPVPAARTVLTRLETQAWQLETKALTAQAVKMTSCAVFNRIGAFAAAASNTVAPGAPYEARLMLSTTTAGLRQRLLADGRPLAIDPRTGHGLVSFQVPPARPGQPDTVRAQWRGEARFTVNGIDSVQYLTVPYFIVKRPQP